MRYKLVEKTTYGWQIGSMLLAAKNKKINSPDKIHFIEDEVTSIIFGALSYINDPDLTWNFLKRLVEATGSKAPDITELRGVEFFFWDKSCLNRSVPGSGVRYVEPDIIVKLSTDNTPLNIIIEIKWNSGLSPSCELAKQWIHRNIEDSEDWLHLYITKKAIASEEGKKNSLNTKFNEAGIEGHNSCELNSCPKFNDCNYKLPKSELRSTIWKDRLFSMTWKHVQMVAASLGDSHGWGDAVVTFLQHQGFIPFVGFSQLRLPCVQRTSDKFYTPPTWFGYLQQVNIPNRSFVEFYRTDIAPGESNG